MTGGRCHGAASCAIPPLGTGVLNTASANNLQGFQGVALLDFSSTPASRVLWKARPTAAGSNWVAVTISAEELRPLVGRIVALQLIDNYHGGWGWFGIDELLLEGVQVVTADLPLYHPAPTPTPTPLPMNSSGITFFSNSQCTGASVIVPFDHNEPRCRHCYDPCYERTPDSSNIFSDGSATWTPAGNRVRSFKVSEGWSACLRQGGCSGIWNYGVDAAKECSTVHTGCVEVSGVPTVYFSPLRGSSVYVGCYVDKPDDHDLINRQYVVPTNVDSCRTACLDFRFFGLQNGQQCWCGNSFGKHGPSYESACNAPCTGNPSESCGAAGLNSVWTVGRNDSTSYIGCFADNWTDRDLPEVRALVQVTVESCRTACSTFTYFGLQSGTQCYCGNAFSKYGMVHDNECMLPCNGNANENCGGRLRNSVWAVGGHDALIAVESCQDVTERGFPEKAYLVGGRTAFCLTDTSIFQGGWELMANAKNRGSWPPLMLSPEFTGNLIGGVGLQWEHDLDLWSNAPLQAITIESLLLFITGDRETWCVMRYSELVASRQGSPTERQVTVVASYHTLIEGSGKTNVLWRSSEYNGDPWIGCEGTNADNLKQMLWGTGNSSANTEFKNAHNGVGIFVKPEGLSCHDGIKNGDELAVDCGGSCGGCSFRLDSKDSDCSYNGKGNQTTPLGRMTHSQCRQKCLMWRGACIGYEVESGCSSDAELGLCNCYLITGHCTHFVLHRGFDVYFRASCDDGLQNGAEDDVDCGGPCKPCPTFRLEYENQKCGGVDMDVSNKQGEITRPNCEKLCITRASCTGYLFGNRRHDSDDRCTLFDTDATTCSCILLDAICKPEPHLGFSVYLKASCTDGVRNGAEQGVDCGGPCKACHSDDCVGRWSEWGSCTHRQNGAVTQLRTFVITTPNSITGVPCAYPDGAVQEYECVTKIDRGHAAADGRSPDGNPLASQTHNILLAIVIGGGIIGVLVGVGIGLGRRWRKALAAPFSADQDMDQL